MFAPDHRQRGSQPFGALCVARIHGRPMSDTGPLFDKVPLLGAGLIGSSIAHAARRAQLARHIAAYVPREETRARAEKAGFAHSLHAELGPAVDGADLVVLATPVGSY